jgi:hypothetical protein
MSESVSATPLLLRYISLVEYSLRNVAIFLERALFTTQGLV